MTEKNKNFVPGPGTCVPWSLRKEELGEIPGDEELVKKEWDKLDEFAYNYIWYWVQR
ncbi:MAG: hypothetical protein ACOYJ1_06435 [Peptococcales bacterium]|jgi:hypothetical protein